VLVNLQTRVLSLDPKENKNKERKKEMARILHVYFGRKFKPLQKNY
jgi:hypothetical protein